MDAIDIWLKTKYKPAVAIQHWFEGRLGWEVTARIENYLAIGWTARHNDQLINQFETPQPEKPACVLACERR